MTCNDNDSRHGGYGHICHEDCSGFGGGPNGDQAPKTPHQNEDRAWESELTKQLAHRIDITKLAYVVMDAVALNAWIIPFIRTQKAKSYEEGVKDIESLKGRKREEETKA